MNHGKPPWCRSKTALIIDAPSGRDRGAVNVWTNLMTGDQSRQLKVGDRVCWDQIATDLGTVVAVTWSGVAIKWDDGHTVSVRHNDMTKVERALANLN
jgi:hypothetical protein